MATVFEAAIAHADAAYAEQGAHEAFREVDRLEQELSRFIDNSDISRINAAEADRPVIVGEDAFLCLQDCARLTHETAGAFDVTVGPLLKSGSEAEQIDPAVSPETLDMLRQRVGMHLLDLDPTRHSVTKRVDGLSVDLGGYGKGYAVDVMAGVLAEWDLDAALLHGGASSARALAPPPDRSGWEVTMTHPLDPDRVLERSWIEHRAVSGSGIRKGSHIVDPRTGLPCAGAVATWVMADSAATCDALSTAFMAMSTEEVAAFCDEHPAIRTVVIRDGPERGEDVLRFGG